MPADTAFMEKLTALCKRRGFIYQSSEIYGGIAGFWDYGPLGVELKRNIKDLWWHDMVTNPPIGPDGRAVEMVGVDCSIIMNPKVWEASGHASGFADLMVDCRICNSRLRADKAFSVHVLDARSSGEIDAVVPLVAGTQGVVIPQPLGGEVAVGMEADSLEDAASKAPEAVSEGARQHNIAEFKRCALVSGVAAADPSQRFFKVAGKSGAPRWAIATTASHPWPSLGTVCPNCGTVNSFTEPRQFSLMLDTYPGAVRSEESKTYLRPETAQGIFANFKNVLDTTRVKVPFGIAQIGKAFRNEINPRNYTFRSREFEQMEIEFFCRGGEATRQQGSEATRRQGAAREVTDLEWYEFWRKVRFDWYVNLGLKSEKLRLRDQGPEELAHYSKACADIEYLFPFSDEFQELEGVAHRGNFDLTQHAKFSGKDLTYFDDEAWQRERRAGESPAPRSPASHGRADPGVTAGTPKNREAYRFLPTVIEPSAGVDRAALAFLCEAYTEDQAPDDKGVMQTRVVMKFHPKLAPIKVAVFPLVNREGMPDIAAAIYRDVKKHMNAFYDEKGAIGRRYRRQDEAGTPFCITVDGDTLKDGTVTIRDRDTLAQVRVKKEAVTAWLLEKVKS